MIEWVTRPTLGEVTEEFCQRLRAQTGVLKGESEIALTGGQSAAVFYDALAAHGVPGRLRYYWSDERLVPPDDPDSNVKLAQDHLLRPADVARKHVFAPDTSLPPEECAAAYAELIRKQVQGGPVSTPQFPLIILGLGEDGHTGSLFPGRDPYLHDDDLVRAVEATPAHPHPRITFTPKLINAATHVWFVITGAKKAWAVEQLAQRTATPTQVPALVVDPDRVRITVFVDPAATQGHRY
ncbi:MAG TPA: 6-phosphogluconolactonase [Terriglobales bacterium]|nr:6-phosphogluconolactonase [Terriglobales bacterium]